MREIEGARGGGSCTELGEVALRSMYLGILRDGHRIYKLGAGNGMPPMYWCDWVRFKEILGVHTTHIDFANPAPHNLLPNESLVDARHLVDCIHINAIYMSHLHQWNGCGRLGITVGLATPTKLGMLRAASYHFPPKLNHRRSNDTTAYVLNTSRILELSSRT